MASPNIDVQLDVSGMRADLVDTVNRKIPWAARAALNNLAVETSAALKREMEIEFDRPTPYTLNSLFVSKATTQNLVALVGLKQPIGESRPATKWLGPEIDGGTRDSKGVERALSGSNARMAEVLSRYGLSGQFVPAAGAKLDAYGNISRGTFAQILSQLGAQADRLTNETSASRDRREGKAGSRGVRSRAKPRYFVGGLDRAGRLDPGIWLRTPFVGGWAIKPVLLAVRSATQYEPRFDFFGTAEQVFAARSSPLLHEALTSEFGA
jgi:hypothetical protein